MPVIYQLKMPMQGRFQMDEPFYEMDDDPNLLEPPQEQYIPDDVLLSEGELAAYEEEVQSFLQQWTSGNEPLDKGGLFEDLAENGRLRSKLEGVEVTAAAEACCLQGRITIRTKEKLTDEEQYILESHVRLQMENGWGSSFPSIAVPGGSLQFFMEEPDSCYFKAQKKYEITKIPHPKYPWLHRIRSLVTINERVPAGTLGGFVQSEKNLSQEGKCWIYDNALCCETAVTEKEAGLFDGAVARGDALVTGDACLYDRAVAEGRCVIRNGEVKEDARIAGNAVLSEGAIDGLSPLVAGHSNVYGEVWGLFVIKDIVLPKEELINPTEDLFIIENGQRDVLVKQKKLEPPKRYVMQQEKQKKAGKKQPER